jgi:hypothetical protein
MVLKLNITYETLKACTNFSLFMIRNYPILKIRVTFGLLRINKIRAGNRVRPVQNLFLF